jgi:hypothetical protein
MKYIGKYLSEEILLTRVDKRKLVLSPHVHTGRLPTMTPNIHNQD